MIERARIAPSEGVPYIVKTLEYIASVGGGPAAGLRIETLRT